VDGSDVKIDSIHCLTRNRNLNSLSIYDNGRIVTNHYNPPYTPHKLTIGVGGIQIYSSGEALIKGPGVVTSSESFLKIGLNSSGDLHIQSVIADNGNRKVGLLIGGSRSVWSSVVLEGSTSNTFTRSAEVSGTGNYLYLNKTNGAIAIQGDVIRK